VFSMVDARPCFLTENERKTSSRSSKFFSAIYLGIGHVLSRGLGREGARAVPGNPNLNFFRKFKFI